MVKKAITKAVKPTQLPEGKIISQRWKIVKKLGEGSFGAVYKVADEVTKQQYAMKVEAADDQDSMIPMEVSDKFYIFDAFFTPVFCR